MTKRLFWALSLILLATHGTSLELAQDAPPPAVDLYGDPLPDGAIARLGTARYRHPGWYKRLAFVSGGRQLIIAEPGMAPVLWDVETGKELRSFPVSSPTGGKLSYHINKFRGRD